MVTKQLLKEDPTRLSEWYQLPQPALDWHLHILDGFLAFSELQDVNQKSMKMYWIWYFPGNLMVVETHLQHTRSLTSIQIDERHDEPGRPEMYAIFGDTYGSELSSS